jgi:hypothetical protein
MPTELPKVQGYVPQAVFDKLNEFKDTHKLKSLSMALTAVLEEYFGINHHFSVRSDSLANQSELDKRVQKLEEQIEILTQTVAALAAPKPLSKSEGESDIESPAGEMITPTPTSESEVNQSDSVGRLLTAKRLADWIGETEGAVNAAAYRGNEAFRKWSENKCEVTWDFLEPDTEAGRKVRLFFRASE